MGCQVGQPGRLGSGRQEPNTIYRLRVRSHRFVRFVAVYTGRLHTWYLLVPLWITGPEGRSKQGCDWLTGFLSTAALPEWFRERDGEDCSVSGAQRLLE